MNSHSLATTFTATVLGITILCAACSSESTGPSGELEMLRTEVAKLAQPYLIEDADVRIKIGQSVFSKVTDYISSLSEDRKTVIFQATEKSGYVWSSGGGFLGCGAYAEINDGGKNFRFSATMHTLKATWQPDGSLVTATDLGFKVPGNIKGHVNGPAGMCEGPSIEYPLGRWSCACPLNGGVGSNAGFQGQERRTFTGHMAFAPQPDGTIGYGLFLTAPTQIPITVSVGLEKIGNIGIPIKIDVPTGQIASGQGFRVLTNKGTMNIGGSQRSYTLELKDWMAAPNSSGLDVRAKATVHLEDAKAI